MTVQRKRSSSDNKIKDMMIMMSWKGNMLCKISRVKRIKLLDLGVIRFIEIKNKIPSEQTFMGIDGGENE